MANFDRFDICEAFAQLESDYNKDGWLQERPSNQRRMESIGVQLHRIGFRPSPFSGSFDELTDNGKEIYWQNVLKWNLPKDEEQLAQLKEFFVPEYLAQFGIN